MLNQKQKNELINDANRRKNKMLERQDQIIRDMAYLDIYKNICDRLNKDYRSVSENDLLKLKTEHRDEIERVISRYRSSEHRHTMDMEWISSEHEQRLAKGRNESAMFHLALVSCFFFVIGVLIA